MNDTRKLLISCEPTFGNVDMVRAAVRGVCADFFQLRPGSPGIMEFCLIVTELMNNTVEHSDARTIRIELVLNDREAVFRLISGGRGFDPRPMAVMPGSQQNQDLPEGGYGLPLIQALADGMEYECREKTNTVTLRKKFQKRKKERPDGDQSRNR